MYTPTQHGKGMQKLMKLSGEISSLTSREVYPPKVTDRVLQEILLVAYKVDRGNVAASSDMLWALKDLAASCGQNSFMTRTHQLVEGVAPDYTKAAEIANWVATELGFDDPQWTEDNFPSFDAWLQAETLFEATH